MEISNDLIISLGISLSLILALFIIIIFLLASIIKIKRRIYKFLPVEKNINVEQMIKNYNKDILKVLEKEEEIFKIIQENKTELEKNIQEVKSNLIDTKNQLKSAIQKIGVVRYNPFDEVGGDFCFAVAFLDEENSGVVINSIYTRENCYNYLKHIKNGVSVDKRLSDEEQQAIKLAIENGK